MQSNRKVEQMMEEEKRRLLDFCRNHNRIFIYGVGQYGRKYLEILQAEQILVAGFIVTKGGGETYRGIAVYDLDSASSLVTEQDGIIPAFRYSKPETIGEGFKIQTPAVLSFDHQIMHAIFLYPMIEKIKSGLPAPASLETMPHWKQILIVRLDVIGDIVCTTAFIREVRKNFPKAVISLVIRRQNYGLLKNCPYINKLYLYDPEPEGRDAPSLRGSYGNLEGKMHKYVNENFGATQFDAVFLPREFLSGRSVWEEFMLACFSRAACRIGYIIDQGNLRRFYYETLADCFSWLGLQSEPMHETMYQLDMLRRCGYKVEDSKLELWPSMQDRRAAKAVFNQNNVTEGDRLIGVGIVGSAPVKNWDPANYKELIHRFHETYGKQYKFVLFGGKEAVETAGLLTEDKEIIVDLTGKLELDVTVACMEQCELYVGSNTGLLHIATAVGKPSVTLHVALEDSGAWCDAGPARWGSRREDSVDLLPPSGLDGCHVACQMGYSHCINQIRPFQVQRAIEDILTGGRQ